MFLAGGFARVTMDNLAYELGMSKRTVYEHFRSKKDLLRQAMLEQVSLITTGLEAISGNPDLDPAEKLQRIMLFMSETLPRPSRQFLLDMQRLAPELWTEIDRHRSQAVQRSFRRMFDEGQTSGLFRKDLDLDLILLLLSALIQKVVSPETLVQVPYTAAQVFRGVMETLMMGILSEDGRRSYRRE